jgi:hypothetical protein
LFFRPTQDVSSLFKTEKVPAALGRDSKSDSAPN